MKRIGILTFHRPVNYGAFLQSFSLSEEIKKRFPDTAVEIIDYISPKEKRKIYLNVLRELKYRGFESMVYEIIKVGMFKKSLKYLMLSKKSCCTDDIGGFYRDISKRYDYIVIGSDAVLNWKQNGYPSAFYPHSECKIPALGYAVSAHGLEYEELNEDEKRYAADAFGRFSFIGARDDNTKKFIESGGYCGELFHTCDPTFFINTEKAEENAGDYKARILKKYKLDTDEEYVVFMLNEESVTKKLYEYYSKNYKVVTLFKNTKNADVFLYDLNPFEWIQVLKNARVVFTQYFHGALLSLKSNVGAVVVDMAGDNKGYESKLYDVIAKRLGLRDLYFTKSTAKDTDKMIAAADRVIGGEFKEKIKAAVENEAKTSESFFVKLEAMLNE